MRWFMKMASIRNALEPGLCICRVAGVFELSSPSQRPSPRRFHRRRLEPAGSRHPSREPRVGLDDALGQVGSRIRACRRIAVLGASNGSLGTQPRELNPKQVSPVRSVYHALLPVNRGFHDPFQKLAPGGHDAFSAAAALYLDKAIVRIANDGSVYASWSVLEKL